jgi:hypothetical protein
MNSRHVVFIVAGLVAVTQAAAPPYFGRVADSGGRLHAPLGHYPRWAPPSPEDVCSAIRARQLAAAIPALSCPPSPERRTLFRAQVNLVRLAAETAAATLAALAGVFVARRSRVPPRH